MKNNVEAASFRDLEWACEQNFRKHKHYWHLYTDGQASEIIFRSAEEMKIGMNLWGICSLQSMDIKQFTFELMNNHMHCILAGEKEDCVKMFDTYKARLWRCLSRSGRTIDMSCFECRLIEITSLQSLRNEIIYANRNGFVVRPDCTPFSYPWGAGACFFNPFLKLLPSVLYDDLTIREKRKICHSYAVDILPDMIHQPAVRQVRVLDGVILPSCYCDVAEAESMFRSAHHYFQLLTRKYEAYGEIAARLHENVFIADEEMYSAVCALCMKYYGVKNPGQLSAKDRVEVARRMRQDFNASNRQIQKILKLDASIVAELFPA